MEWQPISTAPKDGMAIFGVWYARRALHNHEPAPPVVSIIRWREGREYPGSWVKADADDFAVSPKYWLPLESLPKPPPSQP